MVYLTRWSEGLPGPCILFHKWIPGESDSADKPCTDKTLGITPHYSGGNEYQDPEDLNFSFMLIDNDDTVLGYDHYKKRFYTWKPNPEIERTYGIYSLCIEDNRKQMNGAEFERFYETFSEGIEDFDEVKYSFRHFVDDLSRLFDSFILSKPKRQRMYEEEKIARLAVEKSMQESLIKIKSHFMDAT